MSDKITPPDGYHHIGWVYEFATCKNPITGEYYAWQRVVSFYRPNMPENSIRNLKPVFAAVSE